MELYHGSYTKVEQPHIIKGQYTKDFGTGFYCTILKEQAERWAGRFDSSWVNVFVIGAMADDQIYNFVADFIRGVITREQFWVMARFKYPTHQIAFCTDAALNCLTFKSVYSV